MEQEAREGRKVEGMHLLRPVKGLFPGPAVPRLPARLKVLISPSLAGAEISGVNQPMPRSPAADRIIAALELAPLPGEGGLFRVTSRTPAASAIYFLLTPEDFSALHRLDRDEVWHFHAGDAAEHVQLDPASGRVIRVRMGPDVLAGDQPQVRVPAGIWQGARLDPVTPVRHGYALFSCTMAPPWEENGCSFGVRAELQRVFPLQAELVAALTR